MNIWPLSFVLDGAVTRYKKSSVKRIAVVLLLVSAFSSPAASPAHGKQRLRELVVFPIMNTSFGFSFDLKDPDLTETLEEASDEEQIEELRNELKKQSDDIRRLIRLGLLLDQSGKTNESATYLEKALRLCRLKVEQRPTDGLVLTDLGDTLRALDKDAEAESVYRKATLISSNEWKCWTVLGNFLDYRSSSLLTPAWTHTQMNPSAISYFQDMLDSHPSAEQFSQSQELRNEAFKCFDRAVALAPKEPEVYLQRAGHQCSSDVQDYLIRHFQHQEPATTSVLSLVYFSKAAVPDILRAVQLRPKNYRLIGIGAWFEWSACVWPLADAHSTEKPTFDTLPATTRKSIRTAVTQLEDLTSDPDAKIAAGALETLAFVRMLINMDPDSEAMKSDLRQALVIDPSREKAWEALFALSTSSQSSEELVKMCESRLRYTNSARVHLFLARMLVKQEKWDRATQQADLVLRSQPDNVDGHLMLAALAIRQSTNVDFLSLATNHLAIAAGTLKTMPDGEQKLDKRREMILNTAIVLGLTDNTVDAKDFLNEILRRNPDDEAAKEILNALGS
jgi:tetratricopeptide (TPR) repeat protein